MKYRCHQPKDKAYPYYGARGIAVCDRWRKSFEAFAVDIAAELGERPSADHSIDRIDNDGDYKPANVRWATKREQAANRRGLRWLTHNGETRTMTDWSRHLEISRMRIEARLRRGLSVEEALKPEARPPAGRKERVLTAHRQTRSLTEWADCLGIAKGTISARLTRGWSVERALSK